MRTVSGTAPALSLRLDPERGRARAETFYFFWIAAAQNPPDCVNRGLRVGDIKTSPCLPPDHACQRSPASQGHLGRSPFFFYLQGPAVADRFLSTGEMNHFSRSRNSDREWTTPQHYPFLLIGDLNI